VDVEHVSKGPYQVAVDELAIAIDNFWVAVLGAPVGTLIGQGLLVIDRWIERMGRL